MNTIIKVKRRLWGEIVSRTRNSSLYPYIYRSSWHSILFSQKETIASNNFFYAARPNPGAGIGHQIANWIAGYWFSRQFGLQFAHIPFSDPKWENFLGFGEGEIQVTDLLKKQEYYKVRLPLFNESNQNEVDRIKDIIKSYQNRKIVFIAEQDQFYTDQFGVIEDIKHKFYHANARQYDKLMYSKDYYNIAIHIRRGDIVIGQKNKNSNLLKRWQDTDYFEKVLSSVLANSKADKKIAIYLFSQGKKTDFPNFEKFENVHYCLDINAQDSFLHMVCADILITSKSSFSYNPALLSNGIKLCPKDFWHGYPVAIDWILADKNGTHDVNRLPIK